MKFALKSLAAAAAFAVAGVASAATITTTPGVTQTVFDPLGSGRSAELTLVSGSGALAFSNGLFDGADVNTIGGLIGALNVGKVTIAGQGGITVVENQIDGTRVSSEATASIISLSADNVTGQIGVVGSAGGALQTGTNIGGTLTGGTALVSNLRFDLANGQVVADLVGRKAAVGTKVAIDYNLPNTILWTFDKATVTGPTAIKPEYLLAADPKAAMEAAGFVVTGSTLQPGFIHRTYSVKAENVISGLKVTTEGFNFFKNSLGLLSTGVNALAAVNNDLTDPDTGAVVGIGGYGTVRSTVLFTVREVPEPSTYALMGLGLVGMSLVARRRAK
jgi:hypothetical protein